MLTKYNIIYFILCCWMTSYVVEQPIWDVAVFCALIAAVHLMGFYEGMQVKAAEFRKKTAELVGEITAPRTLTEAVNGIKEKGRF
jgi:hypothetical protein